MQTQSTLFDEDTQVLSGIKPQDNGRSDFEHIARSCIDSSRSGMVTGAAALTWKQS